MVVIFLSATVPTRVMHERCAFPSTNTVQAPHWPSPQPYLLPVRSRCSRNTVSKLVCGSASTLYAFPLIASPIVAIFETPERGQDALDDLRLACQPSYTRR